MGHDTSLTQVISSGVSDVSANPHRTDDLDAGGRIWRGRTRLRALWGVSPWWFESTRAHQIFRTKTTTKKRGGG
jgi:hypothetical protein